MPERVDNPLSDLDEGAALRTILEGTSTETGEGFFGALVENLSKVLGTEGAWVTEYVEGASRLRALALWMSGELIRDYEYDLAGTPCEHVFNETRFVHVPDSAIELFPNDPDLPRYGAVSYMGVPLKDVDGAILGHLAVMDTRPMPEERRLLTLFHIFAARASAELRRLRAESQVHEREEKLVGLVDGAMDAIIELDRDLTVTRMNPASEKIFRCVADDVLGTNFARFLTADSAAKLGRLIDQLEASTEGQPSLWIPGGLEAVCTTSDRFPAEATLSAFEVRRKPFYSLILRDVNERLEAERRIDYLTAEAEYLKEEIRALHNFDEIVGESEPLLVALGDVQRVADTDATVLLIGETGTGKELFARAIHALSQRRDSPLVKVNCAAIPAALMESEFFGHEKGAFTGATAKREGRFALAHGGTIFLDEIGELSPDLQAKLLRVLQEGEFEPVGSSRTRKVDVRALAATNRDLSQAVQDGGFREDLYYRLNVFPITVPPLRERGDDVLLLAESFVTRFSQREGITIEPLSEECKRCLRGYSWPGNIRELANVIERAVITTRDGRLDLHRALPEIPEDAVAAAPPIGTPEEPSPILRVAQLKELERNNILRALETSDWRVSGEKGAARLLGMNSSTLASRMRALGISRHHGD